MNIQYSYEHLNSSLACKFVFMFSALYHHNRILFTMLKLTVAANNFYREAPVE